VDPQKYLKKVVIYDLLKIVFGFIWERREVGDRSYLFKTATKI